MGRWVFDLFHFVMRPHGASDFRLCDFLNLALPSQAPWVFEFLTLCFFIFALRV
jgi:hypothetical protein